MRSLRRRHRLTQSALSSALHSVGVAVGRAGVSKIEAGNRKVKDFELVRIARILKVSVGRLLGAQQKPGKRTDDDPRTQR